MLRSIRRSAFNFPIPEKGYQRNLYFKSDCFYIHCQLIDTTCHIHVYPHESLTIKNLKSSMSDFQSLKELLKKKGIKLIVGTHGDDDLEKWKKFVKIFGFKFINMATLEV